MQGTHQIMFLNSVNFLSFVTSIAYSGLGSMSTPAWLPPRSNMQTPEGMGLKPINVFIGTDTVSSLDKWVRTWFSLPTLPRRGR